MVPRDHQTKRMPKAPLPQEPPTRVKDLDPRVLSVAHIDEIAIYRNRVWCVELSRPTTLHSPSKQLIAILVELQHPRIPVTISHVHIAVPIPRNIGGLIEMPHVISRNSHASQRQQHTPFWAEFQDHVG